MNAQGSAFGKLILLGEHVVVYGAPALVGGIGRRLHAELCPSEGPSRLRLLGRETVADAAGDELARAFAALIAQGGAPRVPVSVTVDGDLPPGVGLGFSAAAAVAIADAVEPSEPSEGREERVRARATAWERVYHGNPSGVDVAAAMHGGCIRFSRTDGVRRVVPDKPLLVCVGLTGTRSSTREMVEGVARLCERKPALVDDAVRAVAALVENAIAAVEAGDAAALGELMNVNQMLLAGLLLSNDAIEVLCATAREAGALGAKLTGAGGGGAVVALAGVVGRDEEGAARILAAWQQAGYQGFSAAIGAAMGAPA